MMEITITELRELVGNIDVETVTSGSLSITQPTIKELFWAIGDKYLIRTVTFTYIGKLVGITDTDILLKDASWIPDTGRFHKTLLEGINELVEIEPYPGEVIINRKAYSDASKWNHPLPKETK